MESRECNVRIDASLQRYQPYFCEENVLQLLKSVDLLGYERRVVFISNANKTVAMWGQRAGRAENPENPVVWDYHVVLLLPTEGLILDLDNREKFVWSIQEWLAHSFRNDISERFLPMFRVIPRIEFESKFSSDRSHMLNPETGKPLQSFPPWDAPFNSSLGMNLMKWVEMDNSRDSIGGVVVDRNGLEQLCFRE